MPTGAALLDRVVQDVLDHGQVDAVGLDIQGFRVLTGHYGDDGGNVILATVAHRLLGAVYEEDVVGRIGGDQFVVLAHCVRGDADDLAVFVREIEDAVSAEPVVVANEPIHVGVRVRAATIRSAAGLRLLFEQ
jgi:diguanylate cyclase (GGDEF)-like protein